MTEPWALRGAWLIGVLYRQTRTFWARNASLWNLLKETSLNGLQFGFQVCSHAIGDRANREILDRYELAFDDLPELAS